jgi:hypothetical protein
MVLTAREIVESGSSDDNAVRTLEALVEAEVVGAAPYDFDANKYLLKLYSCFPDSVNVDKIISVIVLSMMKLPAKDLLAQLLMVPPSVETNPQFVILSESIRYLESGHFQRFWEIRISTAATGIFTASGFDDSIRSFIFGNLTDTFRSVKVQAFLSALNLQAGADYESFIHLNRAAILSVLFYSV